MIRRSTREAGRGLAFLEERALIISTRFDTIYRLEDRTGWT